MAIDRYGSYAELVAAEQNGIDYRIVLLDRSSPVTIIAPHGGYIEPPTSALAAAIAAGDHNAYCFDGLQPDRQHHELHITSNNFDEPTGCALVARSDIVVALHGRQDRDAPQSVWIGGLDRELRDGVALRLQQAGFEAATEGHEFPAVALANICNRGKRGKGVQLEIPGSLRKTLRRNAEVFNRFTTAIRSSIVDARTVDVAEGDVRLR